MASNSFQPFMRRTARMSIPQHMKKFSLSNLEIEIDQLECQLHQERHEKEELIEVLESLQNQNRELKEHNEHLHADVQRFAYYHNLAEEQLVVANDKLKTAQTMIQELDNLRELMLEKAQALQVQMQQIVLEESQRRQHDEAIIQGLQNSVQTLTNQNNNLRDHISYLQDMVEDPEEEPIMDEAIGDGEIID